MTDNYVAIAETEITCEHFAAILAVHEHAETALNSLPDELEETPQHDLLARAYLAARDRVDRTPSPGLPELLAKSEILWDRGKPRPEQERVELFLADFRRVAGRKHSDRFAVRDPESGGLDFDSLAMATAQDHSDEFGRLAS